MAYGLWPMAYGIWPTAYGYCLHRMAYGRWHMAWGIQPMAYGLWHMAYGLWHTAIWHTILQYGPPWYQSLEVGPYSVSVIYGIFFCTVVVHSTKHRHVRILLYQAYGGWILCTVPVYGQYRYCVISVHVHDVQQNIPATHLARMQLAVFCLLHI